MSKEHAVCVRMCRNTSILPLLYVSNYLLGVFPSEVDEKNGCEKEREDCVIIVHMFFVESSKCTLS